MIPKPLEDALQSGLLSRPLLAFAVVAVMVGLVQTLRTGRTAPRVLLLLGAAVWPLPDHPFQGPVVVTLSYSHGLHAADLLSVVFAAVALVRPRPRSLARRDARSTAEVGPAGS